jgi:CPA2 family monovalent cation:H+ antiporter-2
MDHLPALISDLGLILGAAALVTLLFKRLKQPIVLGYILAGFLVGPHTHIFPTVTDIKNVEVWAQIGVIVLLFSLGLEFSFRKLMRVGGAATITTLVEVTAMLCIGFFAGRALGWAVVDSIFLGGILSISSTTIIIKAFEELGIREKKFAGFVFGVLIVEDLVAVLILVLLPTLVVSKDLSGIKIVLPIIKLAFFLVLWFVSGIFFLPTLLRKARKFMNNELLLIVALALCFIMVILSVKAGFSAATGAFVMGSILAETQVGERIERLTLPIKELFGAVFFISVGMMIDMKDIPQLWQPILVISLITLIAKPISTMVGAMLSRQQLKTTVQAGMSMSQIGEFSFIIATLGLSLHLTSPSLYPIAVAVSAITTFTTPYMIKASVPAYNRFYAALPPTWKMTLDRICNDAHGTKTTSSWKIYIRSYLVHVVIYASLVAAVIFTMAHYALPAFDTKSNATFVSIVIALVTLPLIAPFLWALTMRKIQAEVAVNLWNNSSHRRTLIVLEVFRFIVGLGLIGFLVHELISYRWALVSLAILVVLLAWNYRRLQLIHIWIERRFITNFHEKEKAEQKAKGVHLTPWDAHIATFAITTDFNGIGKSLLELQLRETMGINIAMIKRGTFIIQAPDRMERIYPDDRLYVIGTDDQILDFKKYLRHNSLPNHDGPAHDDEVSLRWVEIPEGSRFDGKTIKESAIRERTKGLIVGIERNNERMLNPESSVTLQANDLVWIVGNPHHIRSFEELLSRPPRDTSPDSDPQAA